MGLSGRAGLAVTGVTGNKLAAVDFNQVQYHGLAISRFMAERLGGEGLYSGGATVIGDITDGTDYPAFDAIVLDDSGQAWMFRNATATEMTFTDSSGACTAYLVIGQVSGVSPVMATGGLTDFSIIVQLTATAPPAHSLVLGAGAVTASAFTDWTPDAGVNAGPSVIGQGLDIEGALTMLDGGSDHDITILRADVAAARSYTIPEAGGAAEFVMNAGAQSIAGDKAYSDALVATNGRLRNVRDTKFGPPASGTYVTGDLWIDLAGAVWQCTAGGTPGTWGQLTAGEAPAWSGGGATDINTTANWNGGALLDGYRVVEPEVGEWSYDTGNSKWITRETFPISFTETGAIPTSATADPFFALLDSAYDWLVERIGWLVTIGGTPDVSNYWAVKIKDSGGTTIGTEQTYNSATAYVRYVEAVSALKDTATITILAIAATKTGSPDPITLTPMVWARKVRN